MPLPCPPSVAPEAGAPPDAEQATALDPADEQLVGVLVRMWSLASGRRLRPGTRPDQLSPDELMNFWADDLAPAIGRHARAQAHSEAWP
jgi:hypothetical protein